VDEMIRERLKALGMSRRGLWERMASRGVVVTRQAVDAWVRGAARPRLEHVAPLCDALQMTPAERARLLDAAAEEVGRG
jgi:transcriptional regulator with XRE-family HTH domain